MRASARKRAALRMPSYSHGRIALQLSSALLALALTAIPMNGIVSWSSVLSLRTTFEPLTSSIQMPDRTLAPFSIAAASIKRVVLAANAKPGAAPLLRELAADHALDTATCRL